MKRWEVLVVARAEKQLNAITDQRVQKKLRETLRGLESNPREQGKPLSDDLVGYRSVRAIGQRYRIIYRIEEERVVVVVVALGIRRAGDKKKDIYEQAKRLARLGLLDLDNLE